MKIAVASGKGGTGKTTIAAALAAVVGAQETRTTYVDCDIEEPNGHIFLKPTIDRSEKVKVPIPRVDHDKCTFCGECAAICQYNAIAVVGFKVLVFPSLCHNCGGCYFVCPEGAIEEVPYSIGMITSGQAGPIHFFEGRLNIGEALSPPITRALKNSRRSSGHILPRYRGYKRR